MRENVRAFVEWAISRLLLQEPIYEFGSYLIEGQEELANLRPLFPGMRYVGCDIRSGPGVDEVLDLHGIDLPENFVGTILCLDTLEHVEFCHQAVREMYHVLKPDGFCIISSAMNAKIHKAPFDYWRFTPMGFKSLLFPFAFNYVSFEGDPVFPHTILGIGGKDGPTDMGTLLDGLI